MAGERHGRGVGKACYVWFGLKDSFLHVPAEPKTFQSLLPSRMASPLWSTAVNMCKGQVVLVHATKVNWVNEGIIPIILNFGTSWMWVVSVTPWPLYPLGIESLAHIEQELWWAKYRYGLFGTKQNLLTLPALEPLWIIPYPGHYTNYDTPHAVHEYMYIYTTWFTLHFRVVCWHLSYKCQNNTWLLSQRKLTIFSA